MKDELELLKSTYRSELPEKAKSITECVKALQEPKAPNILWETLEHLTHKIAGSSGIYGFPEIAAITRHLEVLICDKSVQKLSKTETTAFLSLWVKVFEEQIQNAVSGNTSTKSIDSLISTLQLPTHTRIAA